MVTLPSFCQIVSIILITMSIIEGSPETGREQSSEQMVLHWMTLIQAQMSILRLKTTLIANFGRCHKVSILANDVWRSPILKTFDVLLWPSNRECSWTRGKSRIKSPLLDLGERYTKEPFNSKISLSRSLSISLALNLDLSRSSKYGLGRVCDYNERYMPVNHSHSSRTASAIQGDTEHFWISIIIRHDAIATWIWRE